MKNTITAIAIILGITGCSGPVPETTDNKIGITPGSLIDSVTVPVSDPLNKFFFSVVVRADSAVANGVYDVHATFAKSEATGSFVMPKGAEHYLLKIKSGIDTNSMVIGFEVKGDTTFYDYFKVTGNNLAITMGYIKSYSFQ